MVAAGFPPAHLAQSLEVAAKRFGRVPVLVERTWPTVAPEGCHGYSNE